MIAINILKAMENAIKPIVPTILHHPQGRGKVGNRFPCVLLRKGNEFVGDRMIKGKIPKIMEFQIFLIVEALDQREIIRLQNLIENAVQNIDTTAITDVWCIEWAGVEVPDSQDSRNAISFDIASIAGNRQLHVINFNFIVQQSHT